MEEFCGSPLWQYNLTWNVAAQPDFTPCFQETILVWVPCLVLWIFMPIEIISIYKTERQYIPVTLLNLFKTFLTTVLCLLSLGELIEVLTGGSSLTINNNTISDTNLVLYVTPIVKSLTYVLVFTLNVLHRNRGIHTSGILFVFWTLMSVTTIINIRSIIISAFHDHDETIPHTVAEWNLNEFKSTVRIVSAPVVIIQLVLSCIADKKANDPFTLAGGDYRNQSPEGEASILSQITFWWLDSLMWLGYKRALRQDDLYAIKPEERTELVSHKFDKHLIPAIQRALDEQKSSHNFLPSFDDPKSCEIDNDDSIATKISPLIKNRVNGLNSSKNSIDAKTHRQLEASALKSNRNSQQSASNDGGKYVGVTKIIIKTFWPRLIVASALKLLASILTFASPILLSRIITFISDSTEPSWRGSLYAGGLFLLSLIMSIVDNREQYITSVNTMRIKTCLTSALYRKTLRLSNQGRKHFTTGEIVNLMSTDTQRVADLVQNVNSIWSAPLQLTISMVLLYQQLGVAIFAGLGVMLINIPFNIWITNKMRTLQQLVMRFKDQRIKLLSETVNGIKIIKIHAWEESFRKRAEKIRAKEIHYLTRQTWYSAAITFAFTCLPFIVAISSFATYVLIDVNNVLDASRVFVSLSLFNIIRVPLAILPMLLTNISTFLVSVRRVNRFLESQEIDPDARRQIDGDTNVAKIKDGSFKWEQDGPVILDKIDIEIPRRKLIAVVGTVGCGKSSLISAIMGDMEKCSGEVLIDKEASISYVPQEAWILNTTFKNNIMFNKVVNEDKYQRVISSCALGPDLETLQEGEQSEIGEKGINLSGGQKQRISLARAVYADTDIYLLDDPLNAVDVNVGRHIFDHVIGPKGMLRDRTRVLVTNKLSVLPEVDYIIVMKGGSISEKGTYEQLLKSRGTFAQLLVKYMLENKNSAEDGDHSQLVDVSANKADLITKELRRLEQEQAQTRIKEEEAIASLRRRGNATEKNDIDMVRNQVKPNKKAGRPGQAGEESRGLTGHEVTQVGSVGIEVHRNFVRAMGLNFVIATTIYIASSAFTLSSNLWLSDWSNDAQNDTLKADPKLRDLRLGVYAGLGLGESACIITSTVLLNMACLRSSHMLHNSMLSRIMRAPLAWFNVTPSGRIINRFSKDIDTVDMTIRFNVRLLMVIALRSVTSLILISVGSVYSIIFIAPIVLLYFLFQMFYISTSRQLKRIESTTKSPIYSHFTETIMGTSSIRAFGVTQEFILESNHRVDVNNSSYYISFVASRWLAMRLEFLGLVVVLTTSLIAVLSRDSISPGIAGLTVTYSLSVTQVLSFLVRTYSDYETNVVSVERLLEYTRTPVEPDDEDDPSDPDWPARGEITYENYSARYRPELDLVLDKFNLKINTAERVGLVGRTGAGKSSVTLSLFRILDVSDGRIVIDGVDISHINLKVLRSRLSIIPQEPILFTGTIRQNIDPTESHPDHEIWRAIDLAHLGSFLRQLPSGLEHQVSEGGSNFSVGQKQLFCLARTLLRRSKILILDEATAAVDVETDNLIQQTIRQEFKDSTILTIAHRLETIKDYDRVVVMEAGRSAEEGKPTELLKNSRSKFYQLADESSSR